MMDVMDVVSGDSSVRLRRHLEFLKDAANGWGQLWGEEKGGGGRGGGKTCSYSNLTFCAAVGIDSLSMKVFPLKIPELLPTPLVTLLLK